MRLLAIIAVVLLVGCGKASDEGSAGRQRAQSTQRSLRDQKSITTEIVETMAQKPSISAGRRTSQKIRDINTQKRKDFDDVLGK